MTELIWQGKYKDGKKVTPVRIGLPFQTIETINESASDREKELTRLFSEREDTEWRNRLIWGDKKYVLPSLLAEFAGKVNLIYIDPPFDTGSDFSFTATIPEDDESSDEGPTNFVKEPSAIEQKAYRDTWGVSPQERAAGKTSLDKYLQWFYETILLLRDLLADDGSIYVHLDWHVEHYAKAILDEIFGYDKFRSEITWKRTALRADSGHFGIVNDFILVYSKTDELTYQKQFAKYDAAYIKSHYTSEDSGGKFTTHNLSAAGKGPARMFGDRLLEPPPGAHWRFSQENIDRLLKEGKIVFTKTGKPRYKMYSHEMPGRVIDNIWTDIPPVNSQAKQDTGYDTQKPEDLLKRIISSASNEDELVLDCFCGSGTTAAVAEKLNRRWITCDLGRFAIHTARKRLLGIANVKPFVVQNLGKYERQQWMNAEFENTQNRLKQENTYKHFIIDLYHAQPLDGYVWLHGSKSGRMIHVGSVEAPVTVEDIKASIIEFWKLVGSEETARTNGIDFLGWDFAFDVNETAAHFAAANKVNASFKKIPHEVLEKKAGDQSDVKFYELASLALEAKTAPSEVSISLLNFIIPPDDVPEEIRGKVTHWSQWIDYWAVDWNYRDDTFHNEWQSYRTKTEPKIALTAMNLDVKPGKYIVLVKVIDILGNDTTKAIEIEV